VNLQDNIQFPEETAKELGFDGSIKDEKEYKAESEKDFLRRIKKKNKDYLVKLDMLERERIAGHITDRINETKTKHDELCDRIDEYDETYRMVRKTLPGADADTPNYRTPLSTVTLEVVHANIMNVFFTPKDIMRVIPTEQGDVPKVKKLSVFGNWSAKNEMNIQDQVDRLFHSSEKNGECPYIVHWKKEYGVDIKREPIPDPRNPNIPWIDPDTQQPIYREIEEPKLLYNGPVLEVFSRKDYIQPNNALMGKTPSWEARKLRYTYDEYLREELKGNMYKDSIKDIQDWGGTSGSDKDDYEGDNIPIGKWEKEFVEFYGRMRIFTIKEDDEDDTEDLQEMEDEFIAIVHVSSGVLCSLRKNRFPLKERPIGVDYFIPDDDGRRVGSGIIEFMGSQQKAYDALFNQYLLGTIQSNNPVGFFQPMGNMRDEPLKMRSGYMYPSADPKTVNFMEFPKPNESLQNMLEMVRYWAQMLFGISDYSAGIESKIDPDAPAKKAEIVVAQGNVRLNMIIKRKNATLKKIFRKWFLLYKENMPQNKFMRIVGDDTNNPWKFDAITLEDFALKSIPDFELTGNILNVNKSFEANKAIAIYRLLIGNPFFNPQTREGMMALHELTKWLIDKLDETGLSRFLPKVQGEQVHTPQEENARFMQGDYGEPANGEDHVYHLKVHRELLANPTVPEEIKEKIIIPHINATVEKMQEDITKQQIMSDIKSNMGGMNDERPGTQGEANPMVPEQPAGMAGLAR